MILVNTIANKVLILMKPHNSRTIIYMFSLLILIIILLHFIANPTIFIYNYNNQDQLSYSEKIVKRNKLQTFVSKVSSSANPKFSNPAEVTTIGKHTSSILYAQTDKVTTNSLTTTRPVKSRIPFRMHHLSKSDELRSPYGMSLMSFLRLFIASVTPVRIHLMKGGKHK